MEVRPKVYGLGVTSLLLYGLCRSFVLLTENETEGKII